MASKKFDLKRKTVLITGAGGLLGVEHAAAVLECGAKVVLTDINKSSLELAKTKLSDDFDPNMILLKRMDVSSLNSIRSVGSKLVSDKIFIDVLINNAAIDPKVKHELDGKESSRLEHFSLDQWNVEVAVGLTGAFLCSQFFGSLMAATGKGGVIVNIASDLSVFSPDQRLYRKKGVPEKLQPVKPVTYSVIKSGLIGLTKYLATYWVDNGVRCNALSPGGVYKDQNEKFVKELSKRIPLGRMASTDEYRSAVQFLCSDASSYMNGQNMVIDGGRSVW